MNLPKGFEEYFLRHWDEADVAALVQGLAAEPSVSIRLNTRRLPVDAEPVGADGRVPWCAEGIYLRERPAFTADPLLHAGAYYVQEASSMFLAHVLRFLTSHPPLPSPHSPLPTPHSLPPTPHLSLAIDLCAAPGGKSTLLRSLLPDECRLLSNEPIRSRVQVLAENLAKWGHPNVLVTQAYAAEIAHFIGENAADLVLADVPCSGEGMMRREEAAVRQWSPAFVADCAALQRSIVADIWPALRPSGLLIYSTCTFNPEEDEQNVEWIARDLGAEVIPVPVEPDWGICGDMRKGGVLPCCHFLPGRVRGEGLFLALLRKNDGEDASEQEEKTHQKHTSLAKNAHSIEKERKGKSRKRDRRAAQASLVTLPTDQLDSEGAPRVELSLAEAVRYLQREALILPPDTPRGIVQVCFRGQRLGLMNNLGTRANNLYPKEWRIRSGFVEGCSLFG